MSALCYLNGELIPLSEATISVLDRGFLFGDGVYEVIPIYDRRPLAWEAHRQRLAHSLQAVHICFDTTTLVAPMRALVTQCTEDNQSVYLQLTRGVHTKRRHKPSETVPPTVFMMAQARPPIPEEKRIQGISCVCRNDFRWQRGHIKSISLLAAVLLAIEADDNEETILLRDGLVTEGYSSNCLVVHGRTISAPISDYRILRGISADLVLQVAQQAGFTIVRRDIAANDLFSADEVWLTSSIRELMPVTVIDNRPVGNGQVGHVFQAVYQALRQHISTEAAWT